MCRCDRSFLISSSLFVFVFVFLTNSLITAKSQRQETCSTLRTFCLEVFAIVILAGFGVGDFLLTGVVGWRRNRELSYVHLGILDDQRTHVTTLWNNQQTKKHTQHPRFSPNLSTFLDWATLPSLSPAPQINKQTPHSPQPQQQQPCKKPTSTTRQKPVPFAASPPRIPSPRAHRLALRYGAVHLSNSRKS